MHNYLTSDELAFISGLGSWAGMEAVNRVRRFFGMEPVDRQELIEMYIRSCHGREWVQIDGGACVRLARQTLATVKFAKAA